MAAQKINFNKSSLDALVCPEGKADMLVYDSETKGLAIRVTKAGGKTFFVVRKVRGKDHRIKLDAFDVKNTKLPLVREKAMKTYANLDVILEAQQAKSLRDSVTLDMAFECMLSRKVKLTQTTVADYRRTYKNYIQARYGERPISSITKDDVLNLHTETTKPAVRPNGKVTPPRERSANKAVSLLGSIFSFCIAFYTDEIGHRIYTYNPVDIMTTIKTWHQNKRDKIRINPDELKAFINGCIDIAETPPLRDVPTSFKSVSAAVLFMLFSGVRPGEIIKIRRSYVCHKTRSIVFPKRNKENEANTLKNGQEFHLVLNDSAYCQLLYAMKHSTGDYVFSGVQQEKVSESNVRDFLARISTIINKHLPRKILRASFISIAERAGVGAFYIKVLCNHDGGGQSVDVTDGYKTAYLSEIRDATSKVETEIFKNAELDKDLVCRGLLSTLTELDARALKSKSVHL
ncbi:phage integrase [Pseudomonas sp. CF161]|uniref:tyrosine-type recombinase/integrase n=1 Tax=Pseudomonas sp. CF161 TaxID=911241 RepID=UPI000354FE21|nr:phage integrase [Pseudomonas sp. CF161]EPL16041.1 putative phage integrase [Pseudomonas sp. CF161]